MSRSILKSSNGQRLIPIPANEGSLDPDYDSLNRIKPWNPIDDEQIRMDDVSREMQRIHDDLERMRKQTMLNFRPPAPPPPPPPFDPMMPQLLPVPQFTMPSFPALPDPIAPMPKLMLTDSPIADLNQSQKSLQLAVPDYRLPIGFRSRDVPMITPPPPPMPVALPAPTSAPVITDDDYGNRILELVLDLRGFLPEDIHIRTEGNQLYVHARRLSAKRDVIDDGSVEAARVAKECRRQYALPEVVRAENLRCYVNQRGQLTISGPLGPELVPRASNKKKVKFASSRN